MTSHDLEALLNSVRTANNSTPVVIEEVERIPEEPCWIIVSHRPVGKGYQELTFNYRKIKIHRLVLLLMNIPIPDGYVASHQCEIENDTQSRQCVNPYHIKVETQLQNVRRSPTHSNVMRALAKTRKRDAHGRFVKI